MKQNLVIISCCMVFLGMSGCLFDKLQDKATDNIVNDNNNNNPSDSTQDSSWFKATVDGKAMDFEIKSARNIGSDLYLEAHHEIAPDTGWGIVLSLDSTNFQTKTYNAATDDISLILQDTTGQFYAKSSTENSVLEVTLTEFGDEVRGTFSATASGLNFKTGQTELRQITAGSFYISKTRLYTY